jgi:hypothetical protein
MGCSVQALGAIKGLERPNACLKAGRVPVLLCPGTHQEKSLGGVWLGGGG